MLACVSHLDRTTLKGKRDAALLLVDFVAGDGFVTAHANYQADPVGLFVVGKNAPTLS